MVLLSGTALSLLIAAIAGWSIVRDSSGRERAESAFRDSEEKYRMLLDGVQGYAIFMLDPGGQIVSWKAGCPTNQRLHRGTDYRSELFLLLSRRTKSGEAGRQEILRITGASGASKKPQGCGCAKTAHNSWPVLL